MRFHTLWVALGHSLSSLIGRSRTSWSVRHGPLRRAEHHTHASCRTVPAILSGGLFAVVLRSADAGTRALSRGIACGSDAVSFLHQVHVQYRYHGNAG